MQMFTNRMVIARVALGDLSPAIKNYRHSYFWLELPYRAERQMRHSYDESGI